MEGNIMKFNELILLYCYYSDLAWEAFNSTEDDWAEQCGQYCITAGHIERMLADMCIQG